MLRERQRTIVAIAEQLRVDAEYQRRVDGLSRAADLGRVVVQRVEVLQDVVEGALGDVFPFILIGAREGCGCERVEEGERRTMRSTSVYCACMRAVTLVSS
jgi:hypothetical protein